MNRHSVKNRLRYGYELLKDKNITSYMLDAELLLMAAAGFDRVTLLTAREQELSPEANDIFENYLELRAAHMPIQYILKKAEFMSLNFYVDERVLIPRPDTEILAELALERIKSQKYRRVLELCTGSGCIAVALAYYAEGLHVTAVDISEAALAVARKNAAQNGVAEKIEFVRADVLHKDLGFENFDLLVSNPPYIKKAIVGTLDRNVKDYEPLLALDGGCDGLDFYRKISADAKKFLNSKAAILFEIGHDQRNEVSAILENAGFKTDAYKDLSGNDRVIEATV